jgi:CCR4-NOT transcription complex subunit 10
MAGKGIGNAGKDTAPTPESAARAAEAEAERQRVQVAALLNLSYLALCVSSPELALSYAEELLAVPEVERSPKLQGHMYAAEALCILNKPAEAAQHVSPTTVGDLLLSPPQQAAPRVTPSAESEEHHVVVNHPVHLYCSDSGEHDPATARCHLYVNMASVFITQNELAKAEKCCQQALLAAPDNMYALQLHVYLELRMGKTEGALHALKTYRASPSALNVGQGGRK